MARRKKKRGGAAGPKPKPTPAAEPVGGTSTDDGLTARLRALRASLRAGDIDATRAALDAWLVELGVELDDPDDAPPDAPAPSEAPRPPSLRPDDPDGPRFSILMAAYNRAELIGDAIASVLRQGFTDYELVIVDDGSTDDTPAVVGHYAATEPRIRFIRATTSPIL